MLINSYGMSIVLLVLYVVLAGASVYLMYNLTGYFIKRLKVGVVSRTAVWVYVSLVGMIFAVGASFMIRYDKILSNLASTGHETQMWIWAIGILMVTVSFLGLAIITRGGNKFESYYFTKRYYHNLAVEEALERANTGTGEEQITSEN